MNRASLMMALLWLTGCGLQVSTSGLSLGTTPRGGAVGGRSSTSDSAAAAATSDADVARREIEDLLGELHHPTQFEAHRNDQNFTATAGTFAFHTYEEQEAHRLASRQLYDETSDKARVARCVERFRYEERPDDPDARQCSVRTWAEPVDPAYKAVWASLKLEGLLAHVSDPEYARSARRRFVERFGWRRDGYTFDLPGSATEGGYGTRLREVPLSTWPRRAVLYALYFARSHNVDAAVIARLEAALPNSPRFRCRRAVVLFVRPYEGGGQYGAPQYAHWDKDLEQGTDIDCATAASLPRENWAMQVMRDARFNRVSEWLGAAAMGDWEVQRNSYGQILSQRRRAAVFFREPI